jgi:predicted kinase
VVSLDAAREELDLDAAGPQGEVARWARERARELVREGHDFVWNATNVSRDHRRRCIDLFAAYGARVRIVYLEEPPERQARRNQERPQAVPWRVVERLLDRWEVPDLTEAHRVDYVL